MQATLGTDYLVYTLEMTWTDGNGNYDDDTIYAYFDFSGNFNASEDAQLTHSVYFSTSDAVTSNYIFNFTTWPISTDPLNPYMNSVQHANVNMGDYDNIDHKCSNVVSLSGRSFISPVILAMAGRVRIYGATMTEVNDYKWGNVEVNNTA